MINNAKQGGFYVSIFRDEAPEVLSGVSVFCGDCRIDFLCLEFTLLC